MECIGITLVTSTSKEHLGRTLLNGYLQAMRMDKWVTSKSTKVSERFASNCSSCLNMP